MNIQILRIGNKFWRPCCYDEVVEIRQDGVIGLDSLRGLISFDEMKPIPVTEELLLKNGFRKKNRYLTFKDFNDSISIDMSLGYTFIEYAKLCFNPEDVTEVLYGSSFEFPNSSISVNILQNIWHLLTDKELKIEL